MVCIPAGKELSLCVGKRDKSQESIVLWKLVPATPAVFQMPSRSALHLPLSAPVSFGHGLIPESGVEAGVEADQGQLGYYQK
jgi:hypothetical protein